MKVSIVIPAFNEVQTIAEVLRRIAAANADAEIVVIDDGSTDGTRDVLHARSGITVIFHEENAGKGAAIRTGLGYVTGEVVIVQDADLEYSPEDYPALLAPILAGHADVVYGSRFLSGPHRVLFFWHSGQLPAEQHAERPQPDRHGDRLVWRLDEPCTALDAKREGTADASQPAA